MPSFVKVILQFAKKVVVGKSGQVTLYPLILVRLSYIYNMRLEVLKRK